MQSRAAAQPLFPGSPKKRAAHFGRRFEKLCGQPHPDKRKPPISHAGGTD